MAVRQHAQLLTVWTLLSMEWQSTKDKNVRHTHPFLVSGRTQW